MISKATDGGIWYYAVMLALGKVVGTYLGQYLDNKLAYGILSIEIRFNDREKVVLVADTLREEGFSVDTISSVYGYKGRKRYLVIVTLEKRRLDDLNRILERLGVDNPSMEVFEVESVSGRIKV